MVNVAIASRTSKHEPQSARNSAHATPPQSFQNNAFDNTHTTSYRIGIRKYQKPFIHAHSDWWFRSMTRLRTSSNMSPALDTKA
jgi:hypothetical protein